MFTTLSIFQAANYFFTALVILLIDSGDFINRKIHFVECYNMSYFLKFELQHQIRDNVYS